MGHLASKHEIVAVLRRFDMDGDAKVNFKEFELGIKSSLTLFGPNKKRPKSGTGHITGGKNGKDRSVTPVKDRNTTPRGIGGSASGVKVHKKLAKSGVKSAGKSRYGTGGFTNTHIGNYGYEGLDRFGNNMYDQATPK